MRILAAAFWTIFLLAFLSGFIVARAFTTVVTTDCPTPNTPTHDTTFTFGPEDRDRYHSTYL